MNHCRICRGYRGVVVIKGKTCCAGCGSHAVNCHVPDARVHKKVPKQVCPSCRSTNADFIETGRLMCTTCGAFFEPLESAVLHNNPERSASMKGL